MDKGALFDSFVAASTFRSIQHSFLQLCTSLDIDPADSSNVYKQLRMLTDWKAQKLWKLLDKRVDQTEYKKQKAADQLNTLVIGAGPCGLRAAIECALLGSRVVVVEQRDRFSRNNVLHLWEFVIHDLKTLGAKIFYPKFCTGSIEHISIRQLQCILLKVALCFGVQVHESVSFVELLFPKEDDGRVTGFRASFEPKGHILSEFDIDILIGADGKRNTIPGFPRDEMRGKLAIGITANFINNKTAAEERVPEISGVAYIFNQAFFKEMYDRTGVDLENIVYYKDETHYFVMCAKKQSLIEMGVIKKDFDDVDLLLSNDNVDRSALGRYAQSAADFATNGKLPALNFATNHRGHEDIAMFDFTSLYSSRCSVRLVERLGKYLLMGIVGDSLHEPFWPTGSGCARGFLGVLDTAWLIRDYGMNQKGPLEIIAERESVYRLLTQVTKDNLHKSISKYTIDPRTRYVSLEISLQPEDVIQIVSTDNPRMAPISQPLILNNSSSVHCDPHLEFYTLWRFCQLALSTYKLRLYDMDVSWRDGRALAGLIAKFRPDILDSLQILSLEDPIIRLNEVFDAVNKYMGIPSPCKPEEWANLAKDAKLDYICKVVEPIRADKDQLKRSLITPRAHSTQKRIQPQQKINRKRSEPIEKLAQDLLGCSSFHVEETISKILKKESRLDTLTERSTKRLERTDDKNKISNGDLEYRYKTATEQKYEDSKHYTKRPQVDRLNPELVHKVEKIVTGDLLKEQINNMYVDKDKKARKNTHKMNKNNIVEMEKKLEQTGMGILYNRKDHLSSQDEKIIRMNAADARKEAESGFTKEAEVQRFKEYDEKIRRSDNAMKKRELAGVDPFCKWKAPHPVECDRVPNDIRKISPPTPPKKKVTVENLQNGVLAIRPIAPVQPKQHVSMSLVDSSCDSVNPRRQENCHLCSKVVYLAERMQVESMYIHKNCFRCAYCGQPLRLGEYGKDKDLEYHYSKKFFCKIHLRVPLREKIARIERAARLTLRASSKEICETLIQEKNLPSAETMISTQTPTTNLSTKKISESQRSAVLSFFSPEQLRDRTVQRMRDQRIRDVISPISDLSTTDDRTPERAEFGSHIRKSSIVSNLETKEIGLNQSASASDSEDDIDQEFIESATSSNSDAQDLTSVNGVKERSESVEMDDEESLTDDDDAQLEEDDLEELEKTVLQIADENPEKPFTDAQVVSVIDKINRRRSAQQIRSSLSSLNSPLVQTHGNLAVDKELDKTNMGEFHTPLAVSFRKSSRDEDIEASIMPILSNESNDQFLIPSDMADDIKKKKIADLERLRTESRMKAKMKTDEELGLSSASVSTNRRSVPCLEISTPISIRSNTVSPPRDRNKIRAFSMIDNIPAYSSNAQIPQQCSPPVVTTIGLTPSVHKVTIDKTDVQPVKAVPSSECKQQPPPSIGLLSRLFSPDAIRKKPNPSISRSETPVNPDKVHCESRKETNILGNAFRRLKMKRGETTSEPQLLSTQGMPSFSPPQSSSVTISTDNREVPCAAVAPSPRIHSESLESHSSSSQIQISVNNKNIRLFQKKAEKIRRQHDEERRRNAQEIQRGLQECEIRHEEIRVRGEMLEKKLGIDPTNHWDLDSWLALVQEREVLKCKEEMLRLNKREMELEVKYRDLNLRFKQMGEGLNDNLVANSELLAAMLTVVEEKKEVKKMSEKSKQGFKRIRNTMDLLREKGSNFQNFDPVFTV